MPTSDLPWLHEGPAAKATVATYTFKTVGECEIRADVYTRPDSTLRPAIVWLHGGALIFGNRGMIHPAQVNLYLNAGYTVIAVDYRLAPETKLPNILTDVQDAIAWVRGEGPRLFGIDAAHLAVVGHSAGGFLTLLAGCSVHPRPQALVALYGYGDIVGPWYSAPSPFYREQPLVSEGEARSVIGVTEIAESPRGAGGEFDAGRDRDRFYLYCRQHGSWPQEVTGVDPHDEDDAVAMFCPVQHVAADYPPTLLLHGDEDTDVPYEQSVMMAHALADAKIPHQLLTIPGGEHGFDSRMADPVVATAFAEVLEFLAYYLRPTSPLTAAKRL